MAKATNKVAVTELWVAATPSAAGTVLISMTGANPGYVQVAIADALADLAADDEGHRMDAGPNGVIQFFGLGTKRVYLKRSQAAKGVEVLVTAF